MAEQSGDYLSRLQEYKQRLEGLMDEAREQVGRQAPDALDKMAGPRGTSPSAWTTWRVTPGNGRRKEKQRRNPQRPPTASQSRRANLQSPRANLRSLPPPNRGRLF